MNASGWSSDVREAKRDFTWEYFMLCMFAWWLGMFVTSMYLNVEKSSTKGMTWDSSEQQVSDSWIEKTE